VEEAARIQDREVSSLDHEQARDVLEELELPSALLEEARAAIQVRRIEQRERANRVKLALLLGVILAAGVAIFGVRGLLASRARANVSNIHAVLLVEGNPISGPLSRSARPEVSLETVLAHTPEGDSLDLTCDWRGPGGDLRYQNHWQTKGIDKQAWPTHCRHRFGAADPSGAWSVEMKLNDRTLVTERFSLE